MKFQKPTTITGGQKHAKARPAENVGQARPRLVRCSRGSLVARRQEKASSTGFNMGVSINGGTPKWMVH